MKTFTEFINESRNNMTTCEINWSSKELVGELTGNETVEELTELINVALDKFNESFTDEKGFYILIHTEVDSQNTIYKPPLYIGLTYKQELGVRPGQISGHQAAYECAIEKSKNKLLFLKLGVLSETSVGKKTEQLYEDIEKCLIFCNEPTCNTNHKSNYESSRILSIKNIGQHHSLNEESNCPEE